MPWCPSCRNEYKEGIKICSDCNLELVEELKPLKELTVIAGIQENEQADKLIKYLSSSQIEAVKEYSQDEDGYLISVTDKDSKKATKLFQAFYAVELESVISNKINAVNDTATTETDDINAQELNNLEDDKHTDAKKELYEKELFQKLNSAPSTAYVKKADKSRDLKSTAVTFLFFGIAGFIFTILNIIGVFKLYDNMLSYTVMIIVFGGCILIGIISQRDSKKAEQDAAAEEEFTKTLNNWLKANITEEVIHAYKTPDNSDEINFFAIIEGIKNAVTEQFGDIDESYLDNVVEEYYNSEFDTVLRHLNKF